MSECATTFPKFGQTLRTFSSSSNTIELINCNELVRARGNRCAIRSKCLRSSGDNLPILSLNFVGQFCPVFSLAFVLIIRECITNQRKLQSWIFQKNKILTSVTIHQKADRHPHDSNYAFQFPILKCRVALLMIIFLCQLINQLIHYRWESNLWVQLSMYREHNYRQIKVTSNFVIITNY